CSSPDNQARIDLEAALPASGRRHRDLPLLAVGADIGIEQDLHVLAKGRGAFGAGPMLELEVPAPMAPGTTVVGDNLHRPIDHVLLGSRIAPNLVRGLTLRRAKPCHQERQRVSSLWV